MLVWAESREEATRDTSGDKYFQGVVSGGDKECLVREGCKMGCDFSYGGDVGYFMLRKGGNRGRNWRPQRKLATENAAGHGFGVGGDGFAVKVGHWHVFLRHKETNRLLSRIEQKSNLRAYKVSTENKSAAARSKSVVQKPVTGHWEDTESQMGEVLKATVYRRA